MGRNQDDDETLDTERDAGVGEGGSERTEAQIEDTDETVSTRDADDKGDDDGEREGTGFRKRVSKLTAQRREAEKQRDAALARVAAYEAKEREASERQRSREASTPAAQKERERREAIRATLDEAYGEGYSASQDELRSEREIQKEQYALNGISYLKSELEDHGIAVDDDGLVRWERAIGSELAEDHALLAQFRRPATQQAAITSAFERVRDGLANPVLKQQGAKPLARIERNRNALLGSGRTAGADEGSPYPDDYVAKPPKNATPAQLDEFWSEHREKLWKRLSEGHA